MAAKFDQALGNAFLTAAGTSFTITASATTVIGADIFAAVDCTGNPAITLTDSVGNTYTEVGTTAANRSANTSLFRATYAERSQAAL